MEVTAKELATRLEGTVLVDIRRVEEWHLTGVIPGSHQLTFFDAAGNADPDLWLRALADVASPEDDLVLICRSGHRTGVILGFLQTQTRYTQARHLAGGILSWLEKGLPVVAVKD
jgi:rhodanese-related sulfurtransferase